MKIYDIKGYNHKITVENNCINECIEVLEKIVNSDSIKKFDGKIINVKLQKALNEAIDRSHGFNFEYEKYSFKKNILDIDYYCNNRCVSGGNYEDKTNYCVYASMYDKLNFEVECIDKRFNFENFKKSALEKIETLKIYQSRMLECHDNIDTLNQRESELKKEIESFNNSLDYVTREFLRIEYKY